MSAAAASAAPADSSAASPAPAASALRPPTARRAGATGGGVGRHQGRERRRPVARRAPDAAQGRDEGDAWRQRQGPGVLEGGAQERSVHGRRGEAPLRRHERRRRARLADDGSSMSDADVTKCVGDLLEKLKFPKQKSPGDAWGIYSSTSRHELARVFSGIQPTASSTSGTGSARCARGPRRSPSRRKTSSSASSTPTRSPTSTSRRSFARASTAWRATSWRAGSTRRAAPSSCRATCASTPSSLGTSRTSRRSGTSSA